MLGIIVTNREQPDGYRASELEGKIEIANPSDVRVITPVR